MATRGIPYDLLVKEKRSPDFGSWLHWLGMWVCFIVELQFCSGVDLKDCDEGKSFWWEELNPLLIHSV